MSEELSLSLFDSLEHAPDPRRERTKLHQEQNNDSQTHSES